MESLNIFGWDIGEGFIIQKLGSLIRLAFLLLIGIPALYLLRKWVWKYTTHKLTAQQAMISGKLVWYLGVLIIAISVLNEFGFKLSHLLGAAGIISIAIGFASQTSVSNIISGLFLIAEKPFQVNDVITVGGVTGAVL